MTSTVCYLATGYSNPSRLILFLSLQEEKLTSVYRPNFFQHSGEKFLDVIHVRTPVPVSHPVVILIRGSFFPAAALLMGTSGEWRGLLLYVVWHKQFLWAFLRAWNDVWYLFLCSPQIFLSEWIKRLICFPIVKLQGMWLVIRHFQLVIITANMVHAEMWTWSKKCFNPWKMQSTT